MTRAGVVTFEGQDGAGKTSVMHGVLERLNADGISAQAFPEFVVPDIADRLIARLQQDKYMRPEPLSVETIKALTEELVADALGFEKIARGLVAEGAIVLKDRFVDSFWSCQGAMLVSSGAKVEAAVDLLRTWLAPLTLRPLLTVLVQAPPELRVSRVSARIAEYGEPFAAETTPDDLEVLESRDEWLERARDADPTRFGYVANDGRLDAAVETTHRLIVSRISRL